MGFLKVLEHKDVGSEVDHVLLPTTKGKSEELVEIFEGRPHNITWDTKDCHNRNCTSKLKKL